MTKNVYENQHRNLAKVKATQRAPKKKFAIVTPLLNTSVFREKVSGTAYTYIWICIEPRICEKIKVCMGHKSKRDTNYRRSTKLKKINITKVLGLQRNHRHDKSILICISIYDQECVWKPASEFGKSKNNPKSPTEKNRGSDPLLNTSVFREKVSGTAYTHIYIYMDLYRTEIMWKNQSLYGSQIEARHKL